MGDLGEFRELLKSTQIGKVVNAFRKHPNSEVSATAKQLVTCWKAAITQPVKKKSTFKRKSTDSKTRESTNGKETEGAPAAAPASIEDPHVDEVPKPDAVGEGAEGAESKTTMEESPAVDGVEAKVEGGQRETQEMEDEPDEEDLFGSEDEAA